jgi:hypothetical protein
VYRNGFLGGAGVTEEQFVVGRGRDWKTAGYLERETTVKILVVDKHRPIQ